MKTTVTKTLLVCAMSAAVAGFAASAQAADTASKEKCYGVAKAGQNDCKGASNACAGHTKKDGEGFLAVPKGLCDKLAGGSTKAPKS